VCWRNSFTDRRRGAGRPARRRLACAFAALLALVAPSAAAAQSPDNILVVINSKSEASVRIGEYYARARAVTQDHIVRIATPATESITRGEYEQTIEGPVSVHLRRQAQQDKIFYIVLTKGVPIRVTGTDGREGTVASVDSELTLLYRKLLGIGVPLQGRVANPYYLGDKSIAEAKPFTRILSDIYLVTRLDGFSVDDVLKLIDRGVAPAREGKFVLDQRSTISATTSGDHWLKEAADRLEKALSPDRIVLESSRMLATTTDKVLGYYSWGSNDPANRLRRFGLDFANGAIGGMFVSTDGRTFAEPPADWVPVDSTRQGGLFGRGSQSLAGDLVRDGITGVSAHVTEPYVDATIRPQILFPVYVGGFTLAESFYLAMPFLSWQTVVIGDPLCTPFPRRALLTEDLHKGLDQDTALPALFSERRVAMVMQTYPTLKPESVKMVLRAEVLMGRGEHAEAEKVLVGAVDVEPTLSAANLMLSGIYSGRNEHDKAIDRLRRILAVEPDNPIALNDLAYALAEYKGQPKEALPLAEKAYRMANQPAIADTVGWIYHLLGEDKIAAPFLERAASGSPTNVDILIHAAIVHAAIGNLPRARAELAAAEKLDPQVASRADVKVLRDKLKGGAPYFES
jgi:uncharacterized protein (TIGR03790 family)